MFIFGKTTGGSGDLDGARGSDIDAGSVVTDAIGDIVDEGGLDCAVESIVWVGGRWEGVTGGVESQFLVDCDVVGCCKLVEQLVGSLCGLGVEGFALKFIVVLGVAQVLVGPEVRSSVEGARAESVVGGAEGAGGGGELKLSVVVVDVGGVVDPVVVIGKHFDAEVPVVASREV